MNKIIYIFLSLVLLSTACKRKDIKGDLKQRRDILETSNWKLTNITDNGGYTTLPACQHDNYYVFDPGGTGRYEEGADNCLDSTGTGNAPTYTGFRWQMTGDLRFIYFLDYGGDPDSRIEWEIVNMTYEEMIARQRVEVDGISHRLDMTFIAIGK